MKIAFYDKDYRDGASIEKAIGAVLREVREECSQCNNASVEFLGEKDVKCAIAELIDGEYELVIAHLSGFWSRREALDGDEGPFLEEEYLKRETELRDGKERRPVWIHISSESQQDRHECREGIVHLYFRPSCKGEKYSSTRPWIEIISAFAEKGTALGLDIVDGRIPKQLRAFFGDTIYYEYLPALSILCQGWLSVYWTLCPSPEGKADNLQKAVGFEDIPPEYRSLLAGRREKTEAPAWWECLPNEGLAEAILHELAAKEWSEHGNIKVLLDRMKAGIPLDREEIVRNAFVEISEVLKRSAE
jgi:hypothetical protein